MASSVWAIWEQTATYLELEKVGGKGPVSEALTMVREEKTGGHVTRDAGQTTRGGAKKESERLVSGNGGDLLPRPRAGPLSVQSVSSSCPVCGVGDVQAKGIL